MPRLTTLYLVGCLLTTCLCCERQAASPVAVASATAPSAAVRVAPPQGARRPRADGVPDATANKATTSQPSAPTDNPFADSALQASQRFGFKAVVEERLTAGGYLYLRVRDLSGQHHWVATLKAFCPDDDDVSIWVMGRADRFQSKRLGREFAPLLFATVR